jgi:DeoR/GlpR family transcriptional regulator of sugar metabolism
VPPALRRAQILERIQRDGTAWGQRVEQASAAKAAIAHHAAPMVAHGSTIFLDASSTTLALARRLMEEPPNELTLVTNSPAIAYEISAEPMHMVVCPGELDQHMRMIAGRWTVEFIGELNFDTAFVSAAGVTLDAGLTTSRRPLADVVNAARAAAGRTVGLIDASKFGRASLVTIAAAQDLDVIVTDDSVDDAVADEYRAAGVRLEIAEK